MTAEDDIQSAVVVRGPNEHHADMALRCHWNGSILRTMKASNRDGYIGNVSLKDEGRREIRVQIEIIFDSNRNIRSRKQKSFSYRKFGEVSAVKRAEMYRDFVLEEKRLPSQTEEYELFYRLDKKEFNTREKAKPSNSLFRNLPSSTATQRQLSAPYGEPTTKITEIFDENPESFRAVTKALCDPQEQNSSSIMKAYVSRTLEGCEKPIELSKDTLDRLDRLGTNPVREEDLQLFWQTFTPSPDVAPPAIHTISAAITTIASMVDLRTLGRLERTCRHMRSLFMQQSAAWPEKYLGSMGNLSEADEVLAEQWLQKGATVSLWAKLWMCHGQGERIARNVRWSGTSEDIEVLRRCRSSAIRIALSLEFVCPRNDDRAAAILKDAARWRLIISKEY